MTFGVSYDFPIWAGGISVLVVLFAAMELGYRVGLKRRDSLPDAEIGGGKFVLASLSALLGLILAFTYAAGVNRHDSRKQAVVAEANAIGTAYLRAGLVDDPGRTELRQALLDYARTRLNREGAVMTREVLQNAIRESAQVLNRLWPITEEIVRQRGDGPVATSLVAAVNEVIDMHTARVAGALDKLPPAVLAMVIFIAAISVAVGGFNAGFSGRIVRWRMGAFAVVLATVMMIVMDYDRPSDGFIRVSQASLHNTIAEMEASLRR